MKIQKKICMLGSFGVGKTSLVNQFVRSVFYEDYLTTIGARIDKKEVEFSDAKVNLVIWDLAGEDKFERIRGSYIKGAAGYLLVVDGTRRDTLEKAIEIQKSNEEKLGDVPFICVINKLDLKDYWQVTQHDLEGLAARGWKVVQTSAKEKETVEGLFVQLSRCLMEVETASA